MFPHRKPDVVIVFIDNFGWGEPGFNAGGIMRGAATPGMDQLAEEGFIVYMGNDIFGVKSRTSPT